MPPESGPNAGTSDADINCAAAANSNSNNATLLNGEVGCEDLRVRKIELLRVALIE